MMTIAEALHQEEIKEDRKYSLMNYLAIGAMLLASLAFTGVIYSIIHQHTVAANLCKTINASRGSDTGIGSTQDPSAINNRDQLRQIWNALGRPDLAAKIPNALPFNCSTGNPINKEK